MNDNQPHIEGYVHQNELDDIISNRLKRERAKTHPPALEQIRDELRDLRTIIETMNHKLDNQN